MIAVVMAVMIMGCSYSNAQGLKDLLNGSTVTNLIEGVFSKSNLKISDLAGEWTTSGPAVCFQSDNLLKKAGGIAAAAALESKLNPYYEKYGFNGSVITIDKDGNFTMQVKKLQLKGTIEAKDAENGEFRFVFTGLGTKIGSATCYIQKTSKTLDLMFDATKLKSLLSTVAALSGASIAKTLSSVLDGYDGLCVGFKCNLTGQTPAADTNSTVGTQAEPDSMTNGTQIQQGIGSLLDLLNKRK